MKIAIRLFSPLSCVPQEHGDLGSDDTPRQRVLRLPSPCQMIGQEKTARHHYHKLLYEVVRKGVSTPQCISLIVTHNAPSRSEIVRHGAPARPKRSPLGNRPSGHFEVDSSYCLGLIYPSKYNDVDLHPLPVPLTAA